MSALRQFAVKAWDVTVVGYGVGRIYAHSRGAALAKAWRSDAFGRITFGDFLKIASAHRAMFVAEAFGEPIKVGGKPAFFVQMEGPYVAFAWPDGKYVLHSHPSDVDRAASAAPGALHFTARRTTRTTGERSMSGLSGGIRIVESTQLVDGPFEDWSQVRSHGRAARRRKRGFPQRIRIYYTPSKKALQMGDTIIMHPVMAAELRKVTAHD